MTANTYSKPQPLLQDTDEQSTVAAPDDSSLIGTEPDEVIDNLDAGSTGSVEGRFRHAAITRPEWENWKRPRIRADLPEGSAGGAGASGAETKEEVSRRWMMTDHRYGTTVSSSCLPPASTKVWKIPNFRRSPFMRFPVMWRSSKPP